MTRRVMECQELCSHHLPLVVPPAPTPTPLVGFRAAVLLSLLLVPLAGAAEAPVGWLSASAAAGLLLLLGRRYGRDGRWGLLCLVTSLVGVLVPRGPLPSIGPALFVATVITFLFWVANRDPSVSRRHQRRTTAAPDRAAQIAAGRRGELHVGQLLARDLSDDHVLLNGLQLPRGAGDIDHVVVGPSGVFVLETKTMAGHIECGADGVWRRTKTGRGGTRYAGFIGDPAVQVARNIRAARDCLRRRVPRLYQGHPLWLNGVVVFADPRTELDTPGSRVATLLAPDVTAHIQSHVPRRVLTALDVVEIVDALLAEAQTPRAELRADPPGLTRQSAQALVETALALPLVLALVCGTIALSRVLQAQSAVVSVAHEAARAGALAKSPADAVTRMHARVELVAPGFGLDPRQLHLEWNVSAFSRDDAQVRATVRYTVSLEALPLVGWLPSPTVRAEHVEWIDPFRSGIARPMEAAP